MVRPKKEFLSGLARFWIWLISHQTKPAIVSGLKVFGNGVLLKYTLIGVSSVAHLITAYDESQ